MIALNGVDSVLAHTDMLEALAERTSQSGAMSWLAYFVQAPSLLQKRPYLLLIVRENASEESLALDDVYAAVLMFEYRVLGLPTGVFCTDDISGFRTVIAPRGQRAAVAQIALKHLAEQGAQIAMVSFEASSNAVPELSQVGCKVCWAVRTRPYGKRIALAPTFPSMLATLGKATRFNLGYYRRRLEAKMPCELVVDARGLLTQEEAESLNRKCLNPDKPAQLRAQFRACWLPGGFLLGLRTMDGRWLSLIGGWRQDDVTVLHWQMNASGYEKLSIGTAMRSYFLEHEIARGARSLMFYGGTPHSIQNAFVQEEVTDLFVRRRSLRAKVLQSAAKLFASSRWFMRSPNFLARAICHEDLEWYPNDRNVGDAMSTETVRMQD